eukprot:2226287-Pyramimonas_sp.AAC.1
MHCNFWPPASFAHPNVCLGCVRLVCRPQLCCDFFIALRVWESRRQTSSGHPERRTHCETARRFRLLNLGCVRYPPLCVAPPLRQADGRRGFAHVPAGASWATDG